MATDNKTIRRSKIKQRLRKRIRGTAEKPRLSVFKSNKEIYVQIVNDIEGKTLAASSSRDKDIAANKGTKTEMATLVGNAIAAKAKEAGVETIVFDRSGYMYHGRVKALAEAARKGGLKF